MASVNRYTAYCALKFSQDRKEVIREEKHFVGEVSRHNGGMIINKNLRNIDSEVQSWKKEAFFQTLQRK